MSDLGFAAAACALGRAIWKQRTRAFDLALVDWDDLDHNTRHFYVNQAGDILRANRPIGDITPPASPLFDAMVAHTRQMYRVK